MEFVSSKAVRISTVAVATIAIAALAFSLGMALRRLEVAESAWAKIVETHKMEHPWLHDEIARLNKRVELQHKRLTAAAGFSQDLNVIKMQEQVLQLEKDIRRLEKNQSEDMAALRGEWNRFANLATGLVAPAFLVLLPLLGSLATLLYTRKKG